MRGQLTGAGRGEGSMCAGHGHDARPRVQGGGAEVEGESPATFPLFHLCFKLPPPLSLLLLSQPFPSCFDMR